MLSSPGSVRARSNRAASQTEPMLEHRAILLIQAECRLVESFGINLRKPVGGDGIFAIAHQKLVNERPPLGVVIGQCQTVIFASQRHFRN